MVHTRPAAAGVKVSGGTVAGIMAENGWAAQRLRAFKRTTLPSDPDKVFGDLIGRDFTSGTRLVGDLTCAPTRAGSTWPLSSICAPAWSSAGRWQITCAPPWLPEP